MDDCIMDVSSYIDPNGRVFLRDNKIYRGIYPSASGFVREILDNGYVDNLVDKGLLVQTWLTEESLPNYDLILEHRRIAAPTYCVEWPFLLMKKAALHTLRLFEELLQEDMYLQDAYPWNIFFEGTSPVFIDFTSIVRAEGQVLWPAYQQFCQFFLFPLYLYNYTGGKVVRSLLHDYIHGIDYRDFLKLAPATFKFTHPLCYVKRIIPEILGEAVNRSEKLNNNVVTASRAMYTDATRIRRDRQRFVADLINDVESITLPSQRNRWTVYYNEEAKELERKLTLVSSVLERINPGTVLDAGCNTGEFSIAAARSGARVIAFDSDESCVERLAQRADKLELNILPLVMDFTNPTPAFGWAARQFPSAVDRLRCDMVFALALVHHLVFHQRQSFGRIIEGLLQYIERWLVIEFVDVSDSYIQRWNLPFDRFSWYTRAAFEHALRGYFQKVEIVGEVTETRTLYLCADPILSTRVA
jgi:SAM-dependent methyltransferase